MVQTETKKYTIETLLPLNGTYNDKHTLTQEDVDEVNAMVKIIESTRSKTTPKSGDRLIYTDKYGEYTDHALIAKDNVEESYICIQPYVPFVFPMHNGISCDVSGGPFTSVPAKELKYLGTTVNRFKIIGHCGLCANGTVQFDAEVSQWEYTDPEPLYGEFSTISWRKLYLYRSREENPEFLYKGDILSLKDKEALQEYLEEYNGTVFPGNFPDQIVIWCFYEEIQEISRQTWEEIDAPVTTRIISGESKKVKIRKDIQNHKVTIYYTSI